MANYRDSIKEVQELNHLLEQQKMLALALGNFEQARAAQIEISSNNEKILKELKENVNDLNEDEKKYLEDIENLQKNINKVVKEEANSRKNIIAAIENANKLLAKTWEYLMQSDKVIKETIKNLGMSGAKAELMRSSFENSAQAVAYLGGNLGDVQTIMEGFADVAGRARALSENMVEDIMMIGKGTGIGVEQATKLAAQYEFMGIDAKKSLTMAQGIVDTSERMGVNTTKVLKNVSDNFKRLNTFTFKEGTKAIAQMAMESEKFRVSMDAAMDVSEKARTLEGAINMVAQLQVMGGEFSKIDMFQAFYESRNEPEKWTKRISEMTKGIVTFRKNSEGTFETFISPADRQRLEYAAKALGISNEELTQIAQKRAELDLSEKQLGAKGFTAKQKEWIQGAMKMSSATGKMQVSIGGTMRDISDLTIEQARAFEQEQVTLKERAVLAQTFDEALKATIEEFKTVLLPMLKGVNETLSLFKPVVSGINKAINSMLKSDFGSGLIKGAGILLASGFLLNKVLMNFTFSQKSIADRLLSFFKKSKSGVSGSGIGQKDVTSGKGTVKGNWFQTASGTIRKGAPELMKAQGMKNLATGGGIATAAVGIGAGIGIAAVGISKLADAMSKLTPEQAKTLDSIIKSLGWFIVGGAAIALAIGLLGSAFGIAAPPMLAFGGAVALVGAGIGIAAFAIGKAAEGLGSLIEKSKGAGNDLLKVGGGIAAIGASMSLFTIGALGFPIFASVMETIALTAPAISEISTAFGNISKSIGSIIEKSKGAGDDLLKVSTGIDRINNSMLSFTVGSLGFNLFTSTLKTIANTAPAITKIGTTFNTLTEKSKETGSNLLKVSTGIQAIGNLLSVFNENKSEFKGFSNTIEKLALAAPSINKIGISFEKIDTAVAHLVGNKEDLIILKNTLESISKINVKGGVIGELANLIKTPLKVEFADKTVTLSNDITLNVDGHKLMNRIYDARVAITTQNMARSGKGGAKPT